MDEHLLRFDKKKRFCFIDFETENLCLYLERNLPWQVAMMRVVGDDIVEEYMRYIQWWRPANVSPEAALVTRFRPEYVTQQGTSFKDVVEDVVRWTTETDYIIGHNVLGFDLHFITAFYRLANKSPLGLAEKMIDTHALAKGVKIGEAFDSKKSSLLEYQYRMIHTIAKGVKTNTKVLGEEYQIPHNYDNLHDALCDLQLNKKIWDKLKLQVEV
jgi:DNA polymerase III epsilon subunit-like protein